VTGACGFIGASLVRGLLDDGWEVHVLIRGSSNPRRIQDVLSRVSVHYCDLEDLNALKAIVREAEAPFVFHLAFPGEHPADEQGRSSMLRQGILGTGNLLTALADVPLEKLVVMGSSLEYGPRNVPLRETHRMKPITFRGVAKAAATLLVRQFALEGSRPVVVLRLFSVYGPWEDARRLVPTAFLSLMEGWEIRLTKTGFRRDFVFVDDVVQASLLAARARLNPGEVINIGTGREWANEQVVELVQKVVGKQATVRVGEFPARPSDAAHWSAVILKAEKRLGWRPRHSLRAGLEKTYEWLLRHRAEYRAAVLGR